MIKNPYRREDHRAAFEQALELCAQGLDYLDIARQLDKSIQREQRKRIAARACRLWENLNIR